MVDFNATVDAMRSLGTDEISKAQADFRRRILQCVNAEGGHFDICNLFKHSSFLFFKEVILFSVKIEKNMYLSKCYVIFPISILIFNKFIIVIFYLFQYTICHVKTK